MDKRHYIVIDGREVGLTNLDKVLFPESGHTKGDLIEYYINMSPYILPYLHNRPFSMLHFPDGVDGKSFFQKQRPADAPEWLAGVRLPSGEKYIDWCLVNDLPSLVYMANRSCIETHVWFSRADRPDEPDIAVFDIDPSGGSGFPEAREAALFMRETLDKLNFVSFPKLSGKRGIHVVIPIEPTPYERVRAFLSAVCAEAVRAKPDMFTMERLINKRGDRVYLDAVQNGRGKTLPSPYSVRATGKATVSAPVTWDELERNEVAHGDFTIANMAERVKKTGDLFAPVYGMRQVLP